VVQIGEIAGIYEQVGNNTQRIWKLLAYVGRYGHQPIDIALRLTVRQLNMLAESVAELVREENATAQQPQ
jgi:hypothetical protein